MRWRSALIIAACTGQACLGLDDCGEGPTPVQAVPINTPPVISVLRVTPIEMRAGGAPAKVSATITDTEGGLTWSLAVDPSSQATGTFRPAVGSGEAVASEFSPAPTSSGRATLRLVAVDRVGAQDQAEVTVFVAPMR